MFLNRYLPFDQHIQQYFAVLKKFDLKKHCSIDDGFVYFVDDFYEQIKPIFEIDENKYLIKKESWCLDLMNLVKIKSGIDCKIDMVFDDQSDTYLTLDFNGHSVNFFDKKIDDIIDLEPYSEELGTLILKVDGECLGTGQKLLTELGTKTLRKKIFYNNFINHNELIDIDLISDEISSRLTKVQ